MPLSELEKIPFLSIYARALRRLPGSIDSTLKTPFRQQASEYDCAPTTFVNALSYLFQRSEIPGLALQRVYQYSLDCISPHSRVAHGTSRLSVRMLGQWLGAYRRRAFRIEQRYLGGEEAHLGRGNNVSRCLERGGVAIIRLTHWQGHWHYLLGLNIEDNWIYCYDPYARTTRSNKRGCYEFIAEEGLQSPNLRIDCAWLDRQSNKDAFHLGSMSERECLLLERGQA